MNLGGGGIPGPYPQLSSSRQLMGAAGGGESVFFKHIAFFPTPRSIWIGQIVLGLLKEEGHTYLGGGRGYEGRS